jgi:hypothetical protein
MGTAEETGIDTVTFVCNAAPVSPLQTKEAELSRQVYISSFSYNSQPYNHMVLDLLMKCACWDMVYKALHFTRGPAWSLSLGVLGSINKVEEGRGFVSTIDDRGI